jgi:hypothetical protein
MDLNQAHGEIAWSHWLAQFKDRSNLEALVRALLKPADGLQDALRDLRDKRSLDSAEGAQLDGIGTIVVLDRTTAYAPKYDYIGFEGDPDAKPFSQAPFWNEGGAGSERALRGIPDPLYRRLLKWKIAINNGHGTTPEIQASLKAIFGASRVLVSDAGNAKMRIWMDVRPGSVGDIDVRSYVPKAAGVGILSMSGSGPKPFGFKSQGFWGFGEGVLAREF